MHIGAGQNKDRTPNKWAFSIVTFAEALKYCM
jgi:hypothetical protein